MVITKDTVIMFELHLVVPVQLVQPIIELVEGEGVVVKAATLAEDGEKTTLSKNKRKSKSQFMSWSCSQPLLNFIKASKGLTFTTAELEAYYGHENNKFANSTVSSTLSHAVKFGLVERIGKGKYQVPA